MNPPPCVPRRLPLQWKSPSSALPKTKDVVHKGYKRAGQQMGMKGVLKDWSPVRRRGSWEGGRSSPLATETGTLEPPVDLDLVTTATQKVQIDRHEPFLQSGWLFCCGNAGMPIPILFP